MVGLVRVELRLKGVQFERRPVSQARFLNAKINVGFQNTAFKFNVATTTSWVQLHKQFLKRNKDLWGDRQPAKDNLYAIDPSDIPKEW